MTFWSASPSWIWSKFVVRNRELKVTQGERRRPEERHETIGLKAVANEETILRKQSCGSNVSPFAAPGNICCGSKLCYLSKCFLVCAPRKHFGKQCFLVCGRLNEQKQRSCMPCTCVFFAVLVLTTETLRKRTGRGRR